MILCSCCNKLVSKADLLEGNTYIAQYICTDCNTISQDEIFKLVEAIKGSKNEFKKSIVKYYLENGYLSQRQANSIKLTTNEVIKYHLLSNDYDSLCSMVIGGTLTDKQDINIINILNDNGCFYLLEKILRYGIQTNIINKLLDNNEN